VLSLEPAGIFSPEFVEPRRAMTLDEITGGSPYGATTIAGGDGSRLASANELEGARYQGRKMPRSPTNCMPDISNPSRRTRCQEEMSHVLQHIDLADPQSSGSLR
jgi:hypothetical protein